MSFLKQFYASVTKSDYRALRSGFIMVSCIIFRKIMVIISSFNLSICVPSPFSFSDHFLLFLDITLETLQFEPRLRFSQIYVTNSWGWFQDCCWYKVDNMQREVPLLLLISFESSLNVCTMSMQMVLVAFCSLIPLAECEWYVEISYIALIALPLIIKQNLVEVASFGWIQPFRYSTLAIFWTGIWVQKYTF